MKATQRDFDRMAPRAAKQCAIFFLCGPDEAGASAAAGKLVDLFADPGERVDLSGAEIKSDPVKLTDEARSSSLFGGTRHILVRVAGEEAHDAVLTYCELAGMGETRGACPVIIVATSATDKSRTAKLLAGRDDALVAMFYQPEIQSVTAAVRDMADAAGLRLGGDLAERIARAAGLDVRLAQSEVDKLALYLDASPQSPKLADLEAHAAIGAKTEEDGFMSLVNAVLSGEVRKLPAELRRMEEVGLNPVGVVLALERRTAQLASLTAKLEPGCNIGAVLDSQRVFFREKRDLTDQLNRWDKGKLDRLVRRLAQLHSAMLSPGAPSDLILAHALHDIARVAGPRRA